MYDKSLNHVFDNKKICSAVPQFKTTYTVESGLRDTINNLKNSEDLSKIDSVWDYSVNTIIEKYEKEQKVVIYIKLIYGVNVCIYYIRSLNVHF